MTKIVPMGVKVCADQEYDIEHEANKTDTVNISDICVSCLVPLSSEPEQKCVIASSGLG